MTVNDAAVPPRLHETRRAILPWATDPTRGMTSARLDALLDRWAAGFDWEQHERRIADLPWVTVAAGDATLRAIHCVAADPHAPVVVLLHGWPDSVLRFERLLPLLTDVTVVVPALPGFPFSPPLVEAGMSANRMAAVVADALDALGHSRYTLSGGDVGGTVAEILAAEHPERVDALHLTNVAPQHAFAVEPEGLAVEAADYLDRAARWFRSDGGYIAEQSTRPNTLAVALADSPAGLAAWIGEKLDSWSDQGAFSVDEVLTWVCAYWSTNTIGSSFASYTEPATVPRRVETPTVLSVFAHDTKPEPRSYAELFLDVVEYVRHDHGGHFAAWEQPEAYAADLRRAVAVGTANRH